MALLLLVATAIATVKLPFPPHEGTMGLAYDLHLPEKLLKLLEQDAMKMRELGQGTHLHGKKTTHFIRMDQRPRFSVEQFALEIAAKVDFPDGVPKEVVGAEYWIQVSNSPRSIARGLCVSTTRP